MIESSQRVSTRARTGRTLFLARRVVRRRSPGPAREILRRVSMSKFLKRFQKVKVAGSPQPLARVRQKVILRVKVTHMGAATAGSERRASRTREQDRRAILKTAKASAPHRVMEK